MIYTKEELQEFLIALDSELSSNHTLIVIGGAAATLHYNSKGGTVDIDTFNSIESIRDAYEKTKLKFPKLKIPLSAALPAQGPINLKERLEKYDKLPLKRLRILIPEVHDWILLKTARCEEKDISDIREVAKLRQIDDSVLKERFRNEMLPFNPGNDETLKYAYLYMISALFGGKVAVEHQNELQIDL